MEKEKSKPPLTSTSAAVDVGATFQTKTIACCSIKEKRSEHKMNASNSVTNDGQNERMVMENLIENKSFEHKADAVAEIHSKINVDETKYAKGHVSGPINSNKLKTPHDDRASGSICVTPSKN